MKIKSAKIVSALALASAISFAAPAHAVVISPGELMYTDFYLWMGQPGYIDGRTGGPALTWREILSLYDCTTQMIYYMTHGPELPAPPPPVNPPPCVDCDPPPPCTDCGLPPPCLSCDPPPPVVPTIPETSTWLMLLMGFGSLTLWRQNWLFPIRKRSST